MAGRTKSKSKISPEKVAKDSLEVIIQTNVNRIHGILQFPLDKPFPEVLNHAPQFLTVRRGRVLREEEEASLSFDVLSVNRDQIVWILPLQGREPGEPAGDRR